MHRVMFYPSESDPGLKQFMDDVGRYRVLTAKEERALLVLSKSGSLEARNSLCRHNIRFVFRVAMRFRGAGLPVLDLVNEGVRGLLKAIERYNPETNLRLLSYAVWWIKQSIVSALNDKARVVRLSAQHEGDLRKLRQANLRQIIGGSWVVEAGEADIKTSPKILEANAQAAQWPLSLDQPSAHDLDTPHAFLASTSPGADDDLYAKERIGILRRLVGKLPPAEKRVITLRYGLSGAQPMTLANVAEIMALSRERIRQIEKEAMGKMRVRGRKFRGEGK